MKILNIILEDRVGGPQLRITQVAKKLKNEGIETIVVIPADKGGFQDLLKKENIKYYEIENLNRPRATLNLIEHLKYIIFFIPSILKIIRIIKEESVDIVHQNDIMQIQGPIASKITGTKLIWHINGIAFYSIVKYFIPFVFFLADKVVASSNAVGIRYFKTKNKIFYRNYEVLYPPVDMKKFHPNNDSSNIKKEFNLTNNYPIIGMVGHLNPIKGHKYFIEAAKIIKDKHKMAKFLIIGEKLKNRKRYIYYLNKLIERLDLKDSVIFTGKRDDIHKILPSLDIFILPSVSEACPMALLEAMASEIPCIASNVGGVPEIITNSKNGFLVPSAKSREIANAVEYFLKFPKKAKEIGKKGRFRIETSFSLNICAKNHSHIYKSLS